MHIRVAVAPESAISHDKEVTLSCFAKKLVIIKAISMGKIIR